MPAVTSGRGPAYSCGSGIQSSVSVLRLVWRTLRTLVGATCVVAGVSSGAGLQAVAAAGRVQVPPVHARSPRQLDRPIASATQAPPALTDATHVMLVQSA